MRRPGPVALGLAVFAAASAARADEPFELKVLGPPPGFEDLEPDTTVVDVIYGGLRLGTAEVEVTPARLRFRDPAAVVRLVPDVIGEEEVEAALTGWLDPHLDRSCPLDAKPECRRLSPDVAGIIYDRRAFTVRIFLADVYLSSLAAHGPTPPPAPHAGLSWMPVVRASADGTSEELRALDVDGTSVVAYDEARVRVVGGYSTLSAGHLDEARGELDLPGLRLGAGLYQGLGSRFVDPGRLLGVTLGTFTDALLDREADRATPLEVTLPRAARVTVRRDGRQVIAVDLPAGTHRLDTARLPDGAYDLDLHIREDGGAERDEVVYFVKTAILPPHDHPLFIGQIGVPFDADEPHVEGLARAVHRVVGGFGLGGALALRDDHALVEGQVILQAGYLAASAGGLATTDLDFGGAASLSFHAGPFWSSLDAEVMVRGLTASGAQRGPSEGWIGPDGLRAAGSLGLSLGWMDLQTSGQWYDGQGFALRHADASVRLALASVGGFGLELLGRGSYDGEALEGQASLLVRWVSPHVACVSEGGASVASGGAAVPTGEVRVALRDEDWLTDRLEADVVAVHDRDRSEVRVGALYEGAGGIWTGAATSPLDGGPARMSGTVALAATVDGDGFAIGGDGLRDAALVLDVGGPGGDDTVDVELAGGSRFGPPRDARIIRVPTGRRTVVPVIGYGIYKVRARPSGKAMLEVDGHPSTVVLFPGNVVTLRVRADRVVSVFARARRPDGTAVADARVSGGAVASATDADGYFEVRVVGGATLELRDAADAICHIQIPSSIVAPEGYAELGPLACR